MGLRVIFWCYLMSFSYPLRWWERHHFVLAFIVFVQARNILRVCTVWCRQIKCRRANKVEGTFLINILFPTTKIAYFLFSSGQVQGRAKEQPGRHVARHLHICSIGGVSSDRATFIELSNRNICFFKMVKKKRESVTTCGRQRTRCLISSSMVFIGFR